MHLQLELYQCLILTTVTICCRMYDRLNNASGALYWSFPKRSHNYGSNSGWYMGTQSIQLCISYMGPIWAPPCIHLGQPIWDPHGAMLHPLYGSLMGSPYGTHIETHVGPIWVPYTLFAGMNSLCYIYLSSNFYTLTWNKVLSYLL